MSEAPKKQFLLIVDEVGMAFLNKVCPMLSYVPVEGMPLNGNTTHQALVTPLQPAVQPIEPPPPPASQMEEQSA